MYVVTFDEKIDLFQKRQIFEWSNVVHLQMTWIRLQKII